MNRTVNVFHVTYATGKKVVINSTAATLDEFCGQHFGSTWEAAAAHGATVVLEGADYNTPKVTAALAVAEDKAALLTLESGLADVEQGMVEKEAEQAELAATDTAEGAPQ